MTPIERIARYEEELLAAREAAAAVMQKLLEAKRDFFRERHGYGVGDWLLFDDVPVRISSTSVYVNYVGGDSMEVNPLTQKGTPSINSKYLSARPSQRVLPWPADRPKPEVKP